MFIRPVFLYALARVAARFFVDIEASALRGIYLEYDSAKGGGMKREREETPVEENEIFIKGCNMMTSER